MTSKCIIIVAASVAAFLAMYSDIPFWPSIVLMLDGLAVLAWSSDVSVDGAAAVAKALGISPFIIGMVNMSSSLEASQVARSDPTQGGVDMDRDLRRLHASAVLSGNPLMWAGSVALPSGKPVGEQPCHDGGKIWYNRDGGLIR